MGSEKEIIIENSLADVARTGVELFYKTAKETVGRVGRFTVAISGGSTPRAMHRLMVQEPYISTIPWHKTHLFWVDERLVPVDDPASNFGAARDDFIDQVDIPRKQVHPMAGDSSPEVRAEEYRKELKDFFRLEEGEFPIFDMILLGIGLDGHTASLFPGHEALKEKRTWVVAVKGGNPDVDRLTMTFPLLNHSRRVVFLICGREKAEILKTIFDDVTPLLPAQKIHPVNGKLTWLLDRDAAALLP